MDRELKKKIKNVKKIGALIIKNQDFIKDILVSELFLKQLMDVANFVEVELVENDEQEENLYLFEKPVNLSNFINEGCILVLKNEEYVVLKGI